MKRGDVVIVSLSGDYGKMRPAVVVQHDQANPTHASIVVCPFSSCLIDAPLFRISVEPTATNGLETTSQIMVDKISAVRRDRLRQVVGRLDDAVMVQINRTLALWLGL
ncbi:transcriptional modulator of MazE/toxin, MazF (plasmid) [Solidesulfovibrio carbinoliphilus subsp. oakridgensis]|uniref:Transcriptional modulator of MazE/toxin, MazF n=1 Tax=Solidesulfovibrio carbinoliphilus subsp. oakridgensis TaxID=694327 RepID=G7QE86_9BACT|nr:type II toxin-antitoxin system PemK/MazF family toxin [Solidesulfovibrio carbinoliphilus]EHJ45980.1 transcriptional modulator of MazE/toxin, MazF [Solidesulfovibrio carbinoliphilus subsp. oakridgensis]